MERRHFLKLAFGFAAGAAALASGAQAAPLAPQPLLDHAPPGDGEAQPAVASGDEADRLTPEQVHWRRRWHRRHRGWRRRHRIWRRRHRGWHRRHWGRHRRRWHHRRYWRRRYW